MPRLARPCGGSVNLAARSGEHALPGGVLVGDHEFELLLLDERGCLVARREDGEHRAGAGRLTALGHEQAAAHARAAQGRAG